ncbi:MAG: hypothetical protein JO284_01990 [Planctomycetaceae bacterium]|nr:hypothetical protein [Planctomycetaceae bacterium]
MPPSDCPPRLDGGDNGLYGLYTEESPRRKDLLRWAVHLLLTVYLLPAICLVLLVSLLAVLADGLARALAWLAAGSVRRTSCRAGHSTPSAGPPSRRSGRRSGPGARGPGARDHDRAGCSEAEEGERRWPQNTSEGG